MRFPNHELIVEPTPKPWWRDLPAESVSIEVFEVGLLETFQNKIDESVASIAKMLDNMMFWEPAREALENGGCRQ